MNRARTTTYFRFAVTTIICFLLLFALNAGSAPRSLAQERSVLLLPVKVRIGDTVTVTGHGFNQSSASVDKYAAIYLSNQEATTLDDIGEEVSVYEQVAEVVWLDETGSFEVSFIVPALMNDGSIEKEVKAGTHYVYVCHYIGGAVIPRIAGAAEFTVTLGEIEISPFGGTVSTEVSVRGAYFEKDSYVTIEFDGLKLDINSGDIKTSDMGEFDSQVIVPESFAGAHTITASVNNDEASIEFTIEPEVFFEKTSGEPGTDVRVTGKGFGADSNAVLLFNARGIATAKTNSLGSFNTIFSVPSLEAGIYDVQFQDEHNNRDSAKFTVVVPPPPMTTTPPPTAPPPVTISSTASGGGVGKDLTITGSGFEPETEVIITYDADPVATLRTGADGGFTAAFQVPVSRHGRHTIVASDGTNTETLFFTVEEEAPPPPQLLPPSVGAAPESPVIFDWEDVTDESMPVTYDFQMAATPDFADSSLLLTEQGLSESRLAVSSAETDQLVAREAPYYWRVRAVDSAANEGEWSAASQFSITPASSPPADNLTWVIYVIIGAVAALFLAWVSVRLFGTPPQRQKKG